MRHGRAPGRPRRLVVSGAGGRVPGDGAAPYAGRMAADYAALEARVAALEQEVRHVLPPKIDAVAYGLSIMHEDLRAFRDETRAALDDQRAQLASHGEQLARIRGTLADHGEQLGEILRRLPLPGE